MSSKKLKKELKLKVAKTLTFTFEDLKKGVSPKKFKRNIRKAAKDLLAGLKVTPQARNGVKKAAPKKRVTNSKRVSVG